MTISSKSLGPANHLILKGSKCMKIKVQWKVCMSITDPPNNQQVLSSGNIKGKIIKERVMLASVTEKKGPFQSDLPASGLSSSKFAAQVHIKAKDAGCCA